MATEMADDTGDVEGDVDQDESVDVDADAVNGDSPQECEQACRHCSHQARRRAVEILFEADQRGLLGSAGREPDMGRSSTPIPAELEIVCGDSRPSGL